MQINKICFTNGKNFVKFVKMFKEIRRITPTKRSDVLEGKFRLKGHLQ